MTNSGHQNISCIKLPYDSEVEWIEAHGTEYLIVNGGFLATDKFDCKFKTGDPVTYGTLFGENILRNGQQIFFSFRQYSSQMRWEHTIGSVTYPYTIGQDVTLHIQRGNNGIVINDNAYNMSNYTRNFDIPYYIFAVNDCATNDLMTIGPASYKSKHRLYWFKQSDDNDILKHDLIPVRFTNELKQTEGAMYDKVEKTLLRNAGSGKFGIGPDKITEVNHG